MVGVPTIPLTDYANWLGVKVYWRGRVGVVIGSFVVRGNIRVRIAVEDYSLNYPLEQIRALRRCAHSSVG